MSELEGHLEATVFKNFLSINKETKAQRDEMICLRSHG